MLNHILSYPVALASGLVVVTVLTLTTRFDNPDLWWHLKNGEIIWRTHTIPSADLFSFSAFRHPWIAHEWLSELSMYEAFRMGGYQGLLLWTAIFSSLIFMVVYLTCWLLTRNSLVSFRSGMVAWCFGTVGLCIRPLILGHLFLALEVLFLELARTRGRKWIWALPPVFALWVNCHASYVFGMAVLGVYFLSSLIGRNFGPIVSEEWDKPTRVLLGMMLLLCAVALSANPIGPRLWLYPFDTLFHQGTAVNAVQEWLPPDLKQGRTLAMLAVFPAILLFCLVRKSTLSVRELLLMLMASALAIRYSRMLFLFGIVISPILCRFGWGRDSKRTSLFANAAFIAGSLAAVIWFFPNRAALERQVRESNPVDAVRFIKEARLTGPMLNEYRFGGYLIWNLPETKVFIDGRADVYDWTGVMEEYLHWANLQVDPQSLLDKYHIKFCLLYENSSIAHVIPYLPGWKKIYSDGLAVVYSR